MDRSHSRRPSSCRTVAALFGLLVVAGSSPVAGQSASDIVTKMLDEYQRRSRTIENYTVVQEVMGMETLSYFEKEMVQGRPVFRLMRSSTNGVSVDTSNQPGMDEIFMMGDALAERARYLGEERISDYDVHVLEIPDLSSVDFGGGMPDSPEMRPKNGRLYLDIDTYMPRRMWFEAEMTTDQGTNDVTGTIDMGDYREVEGFLFPFSTEVSITGLGAAIDPETRAQFEQMKRELDAMPPAQRAMVERMMAGQIQQFQEMMSDSSAPMTIRALVREVRVNAGRPGDR